jgi:hypothetical protein
MGSDGLFDNVYDRDIETTLSIFGGSDQESAQRSGKFLFRSQYVHSPCIADISKAFELYII